ncbi:MAG: 4-(cytidine 5'-diphospho)-2-C-methyl-D-erythritol kinase [Deltaproteobacteria bacterium]|nr:4-(cytidine 5'-diphospho)-2-C-methyl-D-erythritol kinase [Deltaproteobacteria bacterium]MBW2415832.1 4-(cytidine 5'-diphospho)-2-C-methyl-D-erythritol kinase [Deltaproteobacteria bacterium]
MVKVLAPAKLNLGLRILDRRPDGYHEIETVFVPLRLFDELEIEASPEPGIHLECDDPALPLDGRNLAVRAAERTSAALGVEPAWAIRLRKRIPVAAGLGGGSSDAAAVILGLEELAGTALDSRVRAELARGLGADVPFFLDPRPAVGRGVGDRLEPIPDVPELSWLLVRLPFGISTAEAYQSASRELTLPRRGSSIAALLGPSGAVGSPENDLETFAVRGHPEIEQARRALLEEGARAAGMSGSGPTVYGLFDDTEAARAVAARVTGARLPEGAEVIVSTSPGSGFSDWGWGVAKW